MGAMSPSILRNLSPRRVISKLSVRARVIAITLIPVLGFLATGLAYVAGERDVDRAFDSVQRASALADASREFKSAVGIIQGAARGFAAQPRPKYLQILSEALTTANAQFAVILRLSEDAPQSNLPAIERTLTRLQGNFGELQKEYERLGGDSDGGIRAKLNQTAEDVERIIALDMSWLSDGTEHRLLEALLSMRRFEAAYMLDRNFDDRARFNDAFEKLNKIIDGVVAAEILKLQIRETVRNYHQAFEAWLASDRETASRVAGIDSDSEFLIRSADANVERSNTQRDLASAALGSAQLRTRNILIAVGLIAVALGLGFSWWIGLSITRPLEGLADAMQRLADGDVSVKIPTMRVRDELGAMAGAVLVFRDNMIERERLSTVQGETNRAREQRGELIAATIARFEKSID